MSALRERRSGFWDGSAMAFWGGGGVSLNRSPRCRELTSGLVRGICGVSRRLFALAELQFCFLRTKVSVHAGKRECTKLTEKSAALAFDFFVATFGIVLVLVCYVLFVC